MKKQYLFDYDYGKSNVTFEVDLNMFTNEHANATLNFFCWEYDKEENPVDAVMKKYALEAIQLATFRDLNLEGVVSVFEKHEGFCPVNGSYGITLKEVEMFEFDEDSFDVNISNI